jgi:pyruvate/2-oxoglutarate dehydrogenase complex dihydrolipoamide dehydrogenase (E3) component/uncharacterized membrane protein YdjX (TVP38/TMEM64 family)
LNWQKALIFLFFIAVILTLRMMFGDDLTLSAFQIHQKQLMNLVQEQFGLVLALYFALYATVTILSLPGAAALTLVGGALFGVGPGVILVSFASTLGACGSFLLTRFFFQDWAQKKFHHHYQIFNQGFLKDGPTYLLTLRLVPLFPFFVVNALCGLTQLSLKNFYIYSQVGMFPGTLVYVWAGSELSKITELGDILSPTLLMAFTALGLVPLVVKKILAHWKIQKVYKPFQKMMPKKFDRNLIVIGAGAAGLVSTSIARTLRAQVTLIEKHQMGGDCLNTGCVPSKALIHFAKRFPAGSLSYTDIQKKIQDIIAKIAPHDSVERFEKLGAQVLRGHAEILSPWHVRVNGETLSARKLIIATGAEPIIPSIVGIEKVALYTSESWWDVAKLPQKILVLGGGPIGCELAQAFNRLGSQVTLIQRGARLLERECEAASALIHKTFQNEGITVYLQTELKAFLSPTTAIVELKSSEKKEVEFEAVVVALGRKARVSHWGLEKLGLNLNPNGTLEHDEWLRTKYPNIYVCGDVAGPWQFTHVAGHQAWYASVNALLGSFKLFKEDLRVIPRVTFTDPEVASVGLFTSSQDHEVTHYSFSHFDRALCEEAEDLGFIELYTQGASDQIQGATIVGPRAGEMLAEITLAMRWKLGLKKIVSTIHPYPSWSDAVKLAALEWQKKRIPQKWLNLLEKYHDFKRH